MYPQVDGEKNVISFLCGYFSDHDEILGMDEVYLKNLTDDWLNFAKNQLQGQLMQQGAQEFIAKTELAVKNSARFSAIAKRNLGKGLRFVRRRALPVVGIAMLVGELANIVSTTLSSSKYRSENGLIPESELPDEILKIQ